MSIFEVIQAGNMLGALCAFTFPSKGPGKDIGPV